MLAELAMLTSTAYIQSDTVYEAIEKEKRQYVPAALAVFGIGRTTLWRYLNEGN